MAGTKRPQRQAGTSLIGLMVGMVIALLAVVGGMSLYKSSVQQLMGDGGLVKSSGQEGQLASGLLSAQIALQAAGYGIKGAASDSHLILLREAALNGARLSGQTQALSSAAAAGNALLWISNPTLSADPAQQVCHALLAEPDSRALLLLRAEGSCHPLATRWSQLEWARRSLVAAEQLSEPVGIAARRAAGCWPYGALPEAMTGMAAPSAPVEVSLAYVGSVSGASNRYTSCLANLIQ